MHTQLFETALENAMPDAVLVAALRQGFEGEILQPGDAGYDAARRIWNAMIDKRPALIARCKTSRDVVAAVNFARDNHLVLSVRGGGHNVAGSAVNDGGLMIDLSQMKDIHVDPEKRTASAQPGVVFGELDRLTQPYGLAVPGGIVSETGIAGLTLGGGFGWLTRKYGFTCDNLLSAEIVTADGRLLNASAAENPDLFWGIRGGGGNFGVVTRFEYRLRPVGPEVLAGMMIYSLDQAAETLRFYRDFCAITPDELGIMALFRLAPPAPFIPQELHGKPVLVIILCYVGDPDQGERVVAPLRAFDTQLFDGVKRTTFAAHNSSLDTGQPAGMHYYWKSEYAAGLPDDAIETLVAFAANLSSPYSRLAVFHLGGAIRRYDEQAMAVSHRSAEYIIAINTGWADPQDTEVQVRWTRDLWTAIRPFSLGGGYVNFLSAGEDEERVRAAYGTIKFERLAQLKSKYDPQNLFHLNQNIRPARYHPS